MLGACFLDPSALARVSTIARPEDCDDCRNRLVFAAMLAVSLRHDPLDALTVSNELAEMRRINTAGGREYVASLRDETCTAAHAETHARIVADHAAARVAEAALSAALGLLRDDNRGSRQALTDALGKVAGIKAARQAKECRPVGEHVADLMEHIEHAAERGGRATMTGIPSLDGTREREGITGGMFPGQLWVIAAVTKAGKTSLVLNIAEHVAAVQRRPVLFVSREMLGMELVTRMACGRMDSPVPATRVRAGRFATGETASFFAEVNKVSTLPLEIFDAGRGTPLDIRGHALRMREEYGDLGLIAIDYLQIVKPDKRDDSETRQLEEITRTFKELAIEARCPVALLSQFNRGPSSGNRRATPADLRGSGSIENDADVVALLHPDPPPRDDQGNVLPIPAVRRTVLEIALHRQGPTGEVVMDFDRARTRFTEVPDANAQAQDAADKPAGPEAYDGRYGD